MSASTSSSSSSTSTSTSSTDKSLLSTQVSDECCDPHDVLTSSCSSSSSSSSSSKQVKAHLLSKHPPIGVPMCMDFPRAKSIVRCGQPSYRNHRPVYPCGLLMVAGAGGGTDGPMGIYHDIASSFTTSSNSLISSGCITVQLDYRYPNHIIECVQDVEDALDVLTHEYGMERCVIMGWSFGGAVVISAARHPCVAGVITVASQGAYTDYIGKITAPILMFHGSGDRCLPHTISKRLHDLCPSRAKKLVIYKNDDHGISHHKPHALQEILTFVAQTCGFKTTPRAQQQEKDEEESDFPAFAS